jgi:hypothetical protein
MAEEDFVSYDQYRADLADFRADMARFREDVRTELAAMRVEMAGMRVEMASRLPRWAFFGGLAGGLVAAAFRLLG